MFDHIGLKVRNLDASVQFYAAALAPLGMVLCCRDGGSAGFGPAGAPSLWLYADKMARNATTHVAFQAPDRKAVAGFHRAALGVGGQDNGAAGLRADYSPDYYAGFVFDLDGNNIEAVCLKESV